MLAEQKLNQVNVQFVMQETQSLVNAVIAEKLQQVSQVLTENNLDPDILLAEVRKRQPLEYFPKSAQSKSSKTLNSFHGSE